MWMSRKFLLLPGIFPLKIENYFQKISQKNYAKCVLDLLLARSGASDVSTPASRRPAGRNASTSALLPLAVMVACPINVRFTPKSGHRSWRWECPLCAKSGLMHCSNSMRGLGQKGTGIIAC
jgi:hypothetical protein